MWPKLIVFYFILCPTLGHIPDYITTPSNKVEQYCNLADTCIHDTIPICGRMGDETRTFMDVCDLLEYACDTNMVFNHIDDIEGCPANKDHVPK